MGTNPSEKVPLRMALRVVPTNSSSPSTSAMVRTAPYCSGIWTNNHMNQQAFPSYLNITSQSLHQQHHTHIKSWFTSHSLSGARSALQRMILRSFPPPLSRAPPCRAHRVNTLPSWALVCRMIWKVSVGNERRMKPVYQCVWRQMRVKFQNSSFVNLKKSYKKMNFY